jgi:hypothetical protein
MMMTAGLLLATLAFYSPGPAAPSQAGWRGEVPLKEQLAAARRATAKYRDVDVAVRDGYEDINVNVPRMGKHYLKSDLMDDTFDPAKPEILVYAPGKDERLQLVAVEYAQPLTQTPPEGFTGNDDKWFPNPKYNLWTLHAWVWLDNPAGMFEQFNPRVP